MVGLTKLNFTFKVVVQDPDAEIPNCKMLVHPHVTGPNRRRGANTSVVVSDVVVVVVPHEEKREQAGNGRLVGEDITHRPTSVV